MSLRLVFDTSTLVSAALRVGSVPHQALVEALRMADLCASAQTLDELDRVLAREKFDKYLSRTRRHEFVAIVRRNSYLFIVEAGMEDSIRTPCRDPIDNKFLALAEVAEADLIVSSDEDLLVLDPWNGIPVVRPAEFLARIAPPPGEGNR